MALRDRTSVGRPRRAARALASLGTALVLALLATGCGSDEPPETLTGVGSSSETATESPSTDESTGTNGEETFPEGVPTEAPQEPTGLDDDDAGAKAYAEYVFRAFNFYAQRRDAAGIRSLGRCPGCKPVIEGLKSLRSKGSFEVFDGDLDVRRVDVTDRLDDVTVVGLSYDQPPVERIDENGEVLDTFEAAPKKYVIIAVKWEAGQWELNEYAIQD